MEKSLREAVVSAALEQVGAGRALRFKQRADLYAHRCMRNAKDMAEMFGSGEEIWLEEMAQLLYGEIECKSDAETRDEQFDKMFYDMAFTQKTQKTVLGGIRLMVFDYGAVLRVESLKIGLSYAVALEEAAARLLERRSWDEGFQ